MVRRSEYLFTYVSETYNDQFVALYNSIINKELQGDAFGATVHLAMRLAEDVAMNAQDTDMIHTPDGSAVDDAVIVDTVISAVFMVCLLKQGHSLPIAFNDFSPSGPSAVRYTYTESDVINHPPMYIIKLLLQQLQQHGTFVSLLDNSDVYSKYVPAYFFWARRDDPDFRVPVSSVITAENFVKHTCTSGLHMYGWRKPHLASFIISVMLPKFAPTGDLYYFQKYRPYKTILISTLLKKEMCILVTEFVNTRTLQPESTRLLMAAVDKMVARKLAITNAVRARRERITQRIMEKKSRLRFKWQNLCTAHSKLFKLEHLQLLAQHDGIPMPYALSKRELCERLAQKQTFVMMQKAKLVRSCTNESSIMGDEVGDIPPEFFYPYLERNTGSGGRTIEKVYCFDIRDLAKQIQHDDLKNPWTQVEFPNRIIDDILKTYKTLLRTTTNMDDFGQQVPEVSASSALSQKVTTLHQHLPYANSISLFTDAPRETFRAFVDKLSTFMPVPGDVLTHADLVQAKVSLVDFLIPKVRGDWQLALEVRDAYNETFAS